MNMKTTDKAKTAGAVDRLPVNVQGAVRLLAAVLARPAKAASPETRG